MSRETNLAVAGIVQCLKDAGLAERSYYRDEELAFFSREFKPLGTFPSNPFRRKGWEAPTRPGT